MPGRWSSSLQLNNKGWNCLKRSGSYNHTQQTHTDSNIIAIIRTIMYGRSAMISALHASLPGNALIGEICL